MRFHPKRMSPPLFCPATRAARFGGSSEQAEASPGVLAEGLFSPLFLFFRLRRRFRDPRRPLPFPFLFPSAKPTDVLCFFSRWPASFTIEAPSRCWSTIASLFPLLFFSFPGYCGVGLPFFQAGALFPLDVGGGNS